MTPPRHDRTQPLRQSLHSKLGAPAEEEPASGPVSGGDNEEGMAALRDILMENWETYAALAATGFLLAKGKGPALRKAAQRWGRAAFQMIAQMTTDQLEARWNHREPGKRGGRAP